MGVEASEGRVRGGVRLGALMLAIAGLALFCSVFVTPDPPSPYRRESIRRGYQLVRHLHPDLSPEDFKLKDLHLSGGRHPNELSDQYWTLYFKHPKARGLLEVLVVLDEYAEQRHYSPEY